MASTVPKTAPKRCRLLYVEHHAESVELVEQLLAKRKDLRLLHAADVSLGMKLARRSRPDVVLINVDLPGFDAALSANAAPAAIVKGLEAGFFHYLTKPIQAGPLIEALDYALEFAALERSEQTGVPSPSKTT